MAMPIILLGIWNLLIITTIKVNFEKMFPPDASAILLLIIFFVTDCYFIYLLATWKKRKEYHHLAGLPLKYNERCSIRQGKDGLIISAKKQTFEIPYDKIKLTIIEEAENARETMNTEAAVTLGSKLFGAIGSTVINGIYEGSKDKSVNQDLYVLIITYIDGTEEKYLSFGIEYIHGYVRTLVNKCNRILVENNININGTSFRIDL